MVELFSSVSACDFDRRVISLSIKIHQCFRKFFKWDEVQFIFYHLLHCKNHNHDNDQHNESCSERNDDYYKQTFVIVILNFKKKQ